MCLYSNETATRPIGVGEQAVIGTVNLPHGGQQTVVLPANSEPGIACLCVRQGYVVKLSGLRPALADKLGLVGNAGTAVFHAGNGDAKTKDRFVFDNSSIQELNHELVGAGIECLAEHVATVATTETNRHNVHAGVLADVARHARTAVMAGTVASALLMVVGLVR